MRRQDHSVDSFVNWFGIILICSTGLLALTFPQSPWSAKQVEVTNNLSTPIHVIVDHTQVLSDIAPGATKRTSKLVEFHGSMRLLALSVVTKKELAKVDLIGDSLDSADDGKVIHVVFKP